MTKRWSNLRENVFSSRHALPCSKKSPESRGVLWLRWLVGLTVFSDESRMPIEKVRKIGTVVLDELSEISWWISDEVGFSKIGGELVNIHCINATKGSICLTGCTFNGGKVKAAQHRKMARWR